MASLDTDLAKKGVQVSKRGMCAACEKMIVGKVSGHIVIPFLTLQYYLI